MVPPITDSPSSSITPVGPLSMLPTPELPIALQKKVFGPCNPFPLYAFALNNDCLSPSYVYFYGVEVS